MINSSSSSSFRVSTIPQPGASGAKPSTQLAQGLEEHDAGSQEVSLIEQQIDALVDIAKSGSDINTPTNELLFQLEELSDGEQLKWLDHLVTRLAMFVEPDAQGVCSWTRQDIQGLLREEIALALPQIHRQPEDPETGRLTKWADEIRTTAAELAGAGPRANNFLGRTIIRPATYDKFNWLKGRAEELVKSIRGGAEGADVMQNARVLLLQDARLPAVLSVQLAKHLLVLMHEPLPDSSSAPGMERTMVNLLKNIVKPWLEGVDGIERGDFGLDRTTINQWTEIVEFIKGLEIDQSASTQARLNEMPDVLLKQIATFTDLPGTVALSRTSTGTRAVAQADSRDGVFTGAREIKAALTSFLGAKAIFDRAMQSHLAVMRSVSSGANHSRLESERLDAASAAVAKTFYETRIQCAQEARRFLDLVAGSRFVTPEIRRCLSVYISSDESKIDQAYAVAQELRENNYTKWR